MSWTLTFGKHSPQNKAVPDRSGGSIDKRALAPSLVHPAEDTNPFNIILKCEETADCIGYAAEEWIGHHRKTPVERKALGTVGLGQELNRPIS